MPDSATNLAKAELRQLDSNFESEIEQDTWCKVQFNPESLKVSFANQLVQPSGAGDQRGSPARQFVGAGTTKLALTLWFDVGSPQPPDSPRVDDVRKLTKKVAYFITPKPVPGRGQVHPARGPPRVGLVPVRRAHGRARGDARVVLARREAASLEPRRLALAAEDPVRVPRHGLAERRRDARLRRRRRPPATPGTQPLAQAPAGSTVQGLSDAAGNSNWQAVAAANGIENPRLLQAGALLDLNAQAPQLGVTLGVEGGFAVASPQISVPSLDISVSVGIGS